MAKDVGLIGLSLPRDFFATKRSKSLCACLIITENLTTGKVRLRIRI